MRRFGSCLCLLVLAGSCSGCEGFVLIVSTGPLPVVKSSPVPQPIVIGETVHGTFVVPEVCFDVIAPANGTLFVGLSWDRRNGDIDFTFVSVVLPSHAATAAATSDGSSTGSLRVTRGESYRITVLGQKGPVPFTLTTSLK
jgi:hypothetical protein